MRSFSGSRETSSPPNYVFHSAQFPATSANVPLVMRFASGVHRVGMYVGGSGAAGDPRRVTLTAYDRDGVLILGAFIDVEDANATHFLGLEAGDRAIREVRLDNGDTMASEVLDDLMFE